MLKHIMEQKHMKTSGFLHFPIFLSVIFTMAFAIPAYAYLDPGTGSLIYQTVVVVFLAVAATGRIWWVKLKSIFGGGKAPEKEENEE
jgi:hypothetical protein